MNQKGEGSGSKNPDRSPSKRSRSEMNQAHHQDRPKNQVDEENNQPPPKKGPAAAGSSSSSVPENQNQPAAGGLAEAGGSSSSSSDVPFKKRKHLLMTKNDEIDDHHSAGVAVQREDDQQDQEAIVPYKKRRSNPGTDQKHHLLSPSGTDQTSVSQSVGGGNFGAESVSVKSDVAEGSGSSPKSEEDASLKARPGFRFLNTLLDDNFFDRHVQRRSRGKRGGGGGRKGVSQDASGGDAGVKTSGKPETKAKNGGCSGGESSDACVCEIAPEGGVGESSVEPSKPEGLKDDGGDGGTPGSNGGDGGPPAKDVDADENKVQYAEIESKDDGSITADRCTAPRVVNGKGQVEEPSKVEDDNGVGDQIGTKSGGDEKIGGVVSDGDLEQLVDPDSKEKEGGDGGLEQLVDPDSKDKEGSDGGLEQLVGDGDLEQLADHDSKEREGDDGGLEQFVDPDSKDKEGGEGDLGQSAELTKSKDEEGGDGGGVSEQLIQPTHESKDIGQDGGGGDLEHLIQPAEPEDKEDAGGGSGGLADDGCANGCDAPETGGDEIMDEQATTESNNSQIIGGFDEAGGTGVVQEQGKSSSPHDGGNGGGGGGCDRAGEAAIDINVEAGEQGLPTITGGDDGVGDSAGEAAFDLNVDAEEQGLPTITSGDDGDIADKPAIDLNVDAGEQGLPAITTAKDGGSSSGSNAAPGGGGVVGEVLPQPRNRIRLFGRELEAGPVVRVFGVDFDAPAVEVREGGMEQGGGVCGGAGENRGDAGGDAVGGGGDVVVGDDHVAGGGGSDGGGAGGGSGGMAGGGGVIRLLGFEIRV